MAGSSMLIVESLGVGAVDLPERLAQLSSMVLQGDVNVVRHEAEGMDGTVIAACCISQHPEKDPSINVVDEDRPPVIASGCDVVDPARNLVIEVR